MTIVPSGAGPRWCPSWLTTSAAGSLGLCAFLACSPVVSRQEVTRTDPSSPISPVSPDPSGLAEGLEDCPGERPDPESCGCGDACLLTQVCAEGACADQAADCSVDGACEDPTCTEALRYSVDDEIAADLSNGRRLWQRGDAADLDYAQATAHCAGLSLGGLTGWRLPDGAESGSIVLRAGGLKGCGTPAYCAPAIDQAVFPGTEVDLYWTSLEYMPGMHFARSFCDGRSTPYKEDDAALHDVRCVHDPVPEQDTYSAL